MELNGWLSTYTEAHQGRQRKYYQPTEKGYEQLLFLEKEWLRYSAAILALAKGETK
nr:helix-turn-helix transcriptional regulator [Streptococcus dysgalactiae]